MQIIRNIKLTTVQKQILVLAASSEDGVSTDVPQTTNHNAAVKFLTRMGIITLDSGGSISLTDMGRTLGKHQGLIDDSGHPTPDSQSLLPQDPTRPGAAPAGGSMGGDLGMGDMGGMAAPEDGGENFDFESPPTPPEEEQEEESSLSFMRSLLHHR